MTPPRIIAPVAVLLTLTACGGGGTSKAATVACINDVCTVSYPAKARNNQSSSGGPPAEVLGVQTQLFSVAGGQATFRIAEQQVILQAGKKETVGTLSVEAVEVTDTLVVLKYTKS